jgi:hypothetical protein
METYWSAGAAAMKKRPVWAMVAIIVLVILLAAAVYWAIARRESSKTLEDGTVLSTAPEGRMISGFPADLLMEEAAIKESYRLDYKNGLTLPVVAYRSAKSFEENLAMFKERLVAGGWVVLAENTARPVGNIYAVRDKEEVNFIAERQEGGTMVTLSYSNKP